MKVKNKIIPAILLSAGAAAGTAVINKYIQLKAISKNLLANSESLCYKWRFGTIHYTKTGTGKPLLLIHDMDYSSSGAEWDALLPFLTDSYTVYTIDLLGCGRSEKPNLTYTNFLYVQLLTDFIKCEIGHRTNIIATGNSSSLAAMACGYNNELFGQLMFINPESFSSCSQIPGKSAKLYKVILDMPILGTMLYLIAASKKIIQETFEHKYFYNPYHIAPSYINQYYESAHLGEMPKAIYSSIRCNYVKCKINRSLEKIDNSIYILGGAAETEINQIIQEYTECNPAVESSIIANTRHLPQIENPEETSKIIKMFFS